MLVAASFVLATYPCRCPDLGCRCEADYVTVSCEAVASWDPRAGEALVACPVLTGWDHEGVAPRWEDLCRREKSFALDALYTACRDGEVRAEWEASGFASAAVLQ